MLQIKIIEAKKDVEKFTKFAKKARFTEFSFMYKEQDEHSTLLGFVEAIAADKKKAFSMLMRRY